MRKKILVAMSGGVDSSVAAALLKKKGFQVTGIHFRFWKNTDLSGKNKAEDDAKKVCEKLEIPLIIIDAQKEFKNKVVKYFLEEYKKGRTPNPCVFCNENLKFKSLFKIAAKMGIKKVATGHYARLRHERKTQNAKRKTTENYLYKLLEAKDKNKDQSYFLYRLKQNQLARLVFPLGEYKKEEVRKLAKKMKLDVWKKEESQDICFLGNSSAAEFLGKNIGEKKGEIIDTEGSILGKHQGLSPYTLGQRRGIKIGGKGPYFVVFKNYKKNLLVVSNNKENLPIYSKKAILKEVNWIKERPISPLLALARNRYRDPLSKVWVSELSGKRVAVEFIKPQWALTCGQSTVFYSKKGEVLGGGVII